ncbi:MAG: hypothetical protein JNK82_31320 [Myxococcaceae bacterium]|nr:hypothetical protein [Myxococcaceae bacterium]
MLIRPEVARTWLKAALPLVIDLYWLRTINAVGDNDSREKQRALYDYARLITDLDPRFREVYWFVAVSLPWRLRDRSWVHIDLSNDLLRRGLAQYPNDLKMNLLLGYNLITYDKAYVEAARVFQHTATLPRAPPFAGLIATRLYSQGGSPELGIEAARAMRDSAEDEATRAEFEARIADLEIEQLLQKIDAAIGVYKEKFGDYPTTFEELVKSGLWKGPTTDPLGGRLNIGYDHRSHAQSQPRRLELYRADKDE